MERIIQTYRFGPHRVDVVEAADDEGVAGYLVLVDSMVVTDPPLAAVPDLEVVVRIYASAQEPPATRPPRSAAG
jgi:hypothetical protein